MIDPEQLRQITADMAATSATANILKQIMMQAVHLARGSCCATLVSRKQMAALYGEPVDGEEVDLGDGVSLVCDGPMAKQIREWEGASEPVVSDDGALLILPLAFGGLAVMDPVTDAILDPELRSALQTYANLTAITTGIASKLAEARQRSVAQEKMRQKLHEQNILLRELAVVDELTGLYNRRFFERRLAYEFERFTRYHHTLSLMIFDLDLFKRVNDQYGHDMGDRVLQHLATTVQATIRKVDVFCRFGGEEFALLMPDTATAGAMKAAERIRQIVERSPAICGETAIPFTISIGVATATTGFSGDAAALVRAADQALYRAKMGGRNRTESADMPSKGDIPEISKDTEQASEEQRGIPG